MEILEELSILIESAIKEEPNQLITAGNIIKDGYDSEVDDIRNTIKNSKDWLAKYQAHLISESWIFTLKIKYTNISGYFIEIPKTQMQKIPDYFVHTQTLVGAGRFITEELKNFERKVIEGESLLVEREYQLFQGIREKVLNSFWLLKEESKKNGYLDFLCSLAEVAYDHNYVKPEMYEGYDLKIEGGRHPIVEMIEKDFISNDVTLTKKDFIHIITGPNMGWKSTFLRQNALIILMAHIWSFIPARSATIPLTDKIFSRIGANDNLFWGQSTFMVEMQEVANILNNSTEKSFVIVDEVGRGTSTYDGMSLAWAILKQNHDKVKAKTLFATHYHELIDEAKTLPWVKNFSVAVGENEENLIFLRKIVPGGIKKSYGIEVARIAGLSKDVIDEAKKMLKKLEIEHSGKAVFQLTLDAKEYTPEIQIVEKESEVEQEIKNIDVNNMTPIDALLFLQDIKKKIHEYK